MYDVVPPKKPLRPERKIAHGKTRRVPKKAAKPQPPVVQFDWKLPARLRRPVRYELERQRRKRRQQQAIIQFERRPLYSELPSKYPLYSMRRTPKPKRGVEQHTGDVWRENKPGASVMLPPYGNMLAQSKRMTPPARGTNKTKMMQPKPVKVLITKERDMPYEWEDKKQKPDGAEIKVNEQNAIQPPKRRFALPLHFSIFPKNIVPAKAGQDIELTEALKEAWRKKKLYVD